MTTAPEIATRVTDPVDLTDLIRTVAPRLTGALREVADTVAFMDGGSIVEIGPPDQVLRDPREPRTRAFLERVL